MVESVDSFVLLDDFNAYTDQLSKIRTIEFLDGLNTQQVDVFRTCFLRNELFFYCADERSVILRNPKFEFNQVISLPFISHSFI